MEGGIFIAYIALTFILKGGKSIGSFWASTLAAGSFLSLCRDVESQIEESTQHLRYVRVGKQGNI
jgi:hypothetical protein